MAMACVTIWPYQFSIVMGDMASRGCGSTGGWVTFTTVEWMVDAPKRHSKRLNRTPKRSEPNCLHTPPIYLSVAPQFAPRSAPDFAKCGVTYS